jgi:predicted GNAT family N-acyltransferase
MSQLIVRVAELPAELPQIHQIRYLVFQIEQGVDPVLEFDGKDNEAEHILAYLNGQPVGTARIRWLNAKQAKLERVAVLPEVRGLGIGKRIVEKALKLLETAKVAEVYIHAQEQVRDFYQRLGFEAEGEIFEEAGIPHIKMGKQLC